MPWTEESKKKMLKNRKANKAKARAKDTEFIEKGKHDSLVNAHRQRQAPHSILAQGYREKFAQQAGLDERFSGPKMEPQQVPRIMQKAGDQVDIMVLGELMDKVLERFARTLIKELLK